MLSWQDRLYLGTWQLSGDFKPLTRVEAASILLSAWENGIRRFDTAAVYGRGDVELLIGATLPDDAVIVTKLPAQTKPRPDTVNPPEHFYPESWLKQSLDGCRRRLHSDCLHTFLLHNWIPAWQDESALEPLRWLQQQKDLGNIRRIGVSLPDRFAHPLSDILLVLIDVIEAPYNTTNRWIKTDLDRYTSSGVEVLLRSLFERGQRAANTTRPEILADAWQQDTSLVIGMSTPEQVHQNCTWLARLGEVNG